MCGDGQSMSVVDQTLLLDTCLIAGRIMAESGSEAYRVEDTMQRIATNAGEAESVSYETATGIFMSLKSNQSCQIIQVRKRSINLRKVDVVNELSRKFAAQKISLVELNRAMTIIDKATPTFSIFSKIISSGIISCSLMMIMGGTWKDFLCTYLVGTIGYSISILGNIWLEIDFLNNLIAGYFIGLLAFLAIYFGFSDSIDNIIIGSIMPLVPGLAITISFRDILAGHLISGLVRGVETVFTAGAIGIGIGIALKMFAIGG